MVSMPKMRCEISVGKALRGSVDGLPGLDIWSAERAALRLGDAVREAGRDDGREGALEREGVPGSETYKQ